VTARQKPSSLRKVARRSRDGRSEPQGLEKLELMKKVLMQEYFGQSVVLLKDCAV